MTLFTIGAVVSFVGVILWSPTALVVGGVGLAGAGAMTVAGWRIALRGAMGDVFRHVLGSGTIRRAEIVGVLWVIVGAALAALGVTLLSAEPQSPAEPIHHARTTVEPPRDAGTDRGAAS